MADKIMIFGDGDEQLNLYNNLKTGMHIKKVGVKSMRNKDEIEYIYCTGKGYKLFCYKEQIYPYIKYFNKPRYSCVVKNGEQIKNLYGTVPQWLFEIYANGGKAK